MSTLDTRDPSVFPISGYGRLLRPAAMPRLDELAARLPAELTDQFPIISFVVQKLSTSPMINSIGPEFGKRLRNGSYAKLVINCEVLVDGEPHQVAVIIHLDDPSQNGLCYATSAADLAPLCTVRFDGFMHQLIQALEQTPITTR